MASWIKSWTRNHQNDFDYAMNHNIDLARCSGQLSWICNSCGEWWSVRDGVKHKCAVEEGQ